LIYVSAGFIRSLLALLHQMAYMMHADNRDAAEDASVTDVNLTVFSVLVHSASVTLYNAFELSGV